MSEPKVKTVWRSMLPGGSSIDFRTESDALANAALNGGTVSEVQLPGRDQSTRWGFNYSDGTHVSFPDQQQAEEHAAAVGATVYRIEAGEQACSQAEEQR